MATESVLAFKHTCQRCGHVWQSMLAAPVVCPKCTSPYWDKPRQQRPAKPTETP